MVNYDQAATTYDSSLYLYDGGLTTVPPPPNPFAAGFPARPGIGWEFYGIKPSGVAYQLHFTTTGDYTYDCTRSITRAITGFVLVPEEFDKVDLVRDKVQAYLAVDGVLCPMGVFRFTESSRQVDAVRVTNPLSIAGGFGVTYGNTNIPYSYAGPYANNFLTQPTYGAADLHNVTLSDITTDLVRNTGNAETLRTGFDPSQEMQRILLQDGVPYGIAGSASPSRNDVTWDGTTTDLEKIQQLAVLAGHRNPWMDNNGIVRSVSADTTSVDIIDLDDLKPTAESLVITESFLTAPNRIIVNDNSSADRTIQGQWDAPASAPHSYANLGYWRTQVEDVQGLGSNEHAQQVAQALGEAATARKLDCEIKPTCALDGPQLVSFQGALWMCVAWSISTSPNTTMSVTFQEVLTS